MNNQHLKQIKEDIQALMLKAENAMKAARQAENAAQSAAYYAGDCITLAARLYENATALSEVE